MMMTMARCKFGPVVRVHPRSLLNHVRFIVVVGALIAIPSAGRVGATDCNNNGIEDACDISCGPDGDPCQVPGCGMRPDCNGNGIPDECDFDQGPSVFFDDVPTSTIDPSKWSVNVGAATIGFFVSPPLSLALNSTDRLESVAIDLSGRIAGRVRFSWRTFLTEGSDRLDLEYWNGSQWNLILRLFGGSNSPFWQESTTVLPLDAFHAGFKFRFVGGNNQSDDVWAIDDISVFLPSSDCNSNGLLDDCESEDCNTNGIPDTVDICSGTSVDCDQDGVPDECELEDCDTNGVPDIEDTCGGLVPDCNGNFVPDSCDVASGASDDCNSNGVPDECDPDCNNNGIPDDCDIAAMTSQDCDLSGTPDECETGMVVARDQCDDAMRVIPGVIYTGTTASATPGGSCTCGNSNSARDVWYKYVPLTDGGVLIALCNSQYDTVLSLHSECPGDISNEVACNHIGCSYGTPGGRSVLSAQVSGGSEYWIRISGNNGASGNFEMVLDGPMSYLPDCDESGTPDSCQPGGIDCNANGILDWCAYDHTYLAASDRLSPLDKDHPQSFTVVAPPIARSDVAIKVVGASNLILNGTYVAVDLNGVPIGSVFGGTTDCSIRVQTLVVTERKWNDAILAGSGNVLVNLTPTSLVMPICPSSFIQFTVTYQSDTDCDDNGVPDSCDLDGAGELDCNANGRLDQCELPTDGPAAEDCENARAVIPGVVYTGTLDLTTSGGLSSCGPQNGRDVWYRYSPAENGTAIISLCGSSFATRLAVHTGCPATPQNTIQCNTVPSDSNAQCGNGSRIVLNVTGGESYVIRVMGGAGEVEDYRFQLFGPPSSVDDCNSNGMPDSCDIADMTSIDCNSNGIPDECDLIPSADWADNCEDAELIVPGVTYYGSTVTATSAEILGCDFVNSDVWYRYIPIESGSMNVSLCGSLFDTTLSVYNSCPNSADSILICMDDSCEKQSDITVSVIGMREYWIRISGHNAQKGEYQLNLSGPPTFGPDCNGNGVPDACDIASNTSLDCNSNGFPDECEPDCDADGVPDSCELSLGLESDCNANGIPDSCDLSTGFSVDCNSNGIPDECDIGKVRMTSPVLAPIGDGYSQNFTFPSPPAAIGDVKITMELLAHLSGVGPMRLWLNGTEAASAGTQVCPGPAMEFESTLSGDVFNAIVAGGDADFRISSGISFDPYVCGAPTYAIVTLEYATAATSLDCNDNGVPDECDLVSGSTDCNANSVPDECEPDCNGNGIADACEVPPIGSQPDCDSNGIPDDCQLVEEVVIESPVYAPFDRDQPWITFTVEDVPDALGPVLIEVTARAGFTGSGTDVVLGLNDNDHFASLFGGPTPECVEVTDQRTISESVWNAILLASQNTIEFEIRPSLTISGPCNESFIRLKLSYQRQNDCNANLIPDHCDIATGSSQDCNSDGIPDECSPDCNTNGVSDACDIFSANSLDCDLDRIPDECEVPPLGMGPDCNANGIPDNCEADCNGNGIPDVCDLTVPLALFSFVTAYGVGDQPWSVIAEDLNGDGRSEIITVNYQANTLSVLQNVGGGGFLPQQLIGVRTRPRAAVAVDLDQDGDKDLAVAHWQSRVVSILINNGDATFQPRIDLVTDTFGDYTGITAGDFDLDGDTDLGASSATGRIALFMNQGLNVGVWSGMTVGPVILQSGSPEDIAKFDANGDGLPDLVTANLSANSVSVLLNQGVDGGGSWLGFGPASGFSVGVWPDAIAIGDFNLDGQADIATANRNSDNISVLINQGSDGGGAWLGMAATPQISIGVQPRDLIADDINGDGAIDLVATNTGFSSVPGRAVSLIVNGGLNQSSVWQGFSSGGTASCGSSPYGLCAADFDLDGDRDLAATGYDNDELWILENTGNGEFPVNDVFYVGRDPYSLAIADFDKNGHVDIASVQRLDASMVVQLNEGGAVFHASAPFPVGAGPEFIAVADFDGDTWLDVASANYGTNAVGISFNLGMDAMGNWLGFGVQQSYATGSHPVHVISAELDGTNGPDLVVANSSGQSLSVLLNDGNGQFRVSSISLASSPFEVAIGDFDGDGDNDLAFARSGSNSIFTYFNDGVGVFSPGPVFPGRATPSIVATDVDNDGDIDLVYSGTGVDVALNLGNDGSGSWLGFAVATSYPAAGGAYAVWATDLNNDNLPEIIATNQQEHTASVMLNIGSGTYQFAGSWAAGNMPLAIASGDLNGDNLTDLAISSIGSDIVSVVLNVSPGSALPDCNSNLLPDDCDVRGDMDGNGIVDGNDIPGFITNLIDGPCSMLADVNGDSMVNGADIQELVDAILGSR